MHFWCPKMNFWSFGIQNAFLVEENAFSIDPKGKEGIGNLPGKSPKSPTFGTSKLKNIG